MAVSFLYASGQDHAAEGCATSCRAPLIAQVHNGGAALPSIKLKVQFVGLDHASFHCFVIEGTIHRRLRPFFPSDPAGGSPPLHAPLVTAAGPDLNASGGTATDSVEYHPPANAPDAPDDSGVGQAPEQEATSSWQHEPASESGTVHRLLFAGR